MSLGIEDFKEVRPLVPQFEQPVEKVAKICRAVEGLSKCGGVAVWWRIWLGHEFKTTCGLSHVNCFILFQYIPISNDKGVA